VGQGGSELSVCRPSAYICNSMDTLSLTQLRDRSRKAVLCSVHKAHYPRRLGLQGATSRPQQMSQNDFVFSATLYSFGTVALMRVVGLHHWIYFQTLFLGMRCWFFYFWATVLSVVSKIIVLKIFNRDFIYSSILSIKILVISLQFLQISNLSKIFKFLLHNCKHNSTIPALN
jgi:hypothetical protein